MLAKVRLELAHGRAGLPADPTGFPALAALAAPWLARRRATHRAWRDDVSRWNVHLKPFFGHQRPAEVDAGRIRAFVEDRLRAVVGKDEDGKPTTLNRATVGHAVRLLSTFFSDLIERPRETGVTVNPVRSLPRSTRKLFKATHRPKDTPYIKQLASIQALHAKLPEPVATAYAIGSLAGLRTGEVLGISWEDIDFDRHVIHVHRQVQDSTLVGLKDEDPRDVPLLDALRPALLAHRARGKGEGLLFQASQPGRRSGRNGTRSRFMRPNTLHDALAEALVALKLPTATWYQATRHTFASHWVIGGGSIERLALILGHSSSEVTRHYAHLSPDHLGPEDRARLAAPLKIGHSLATEPESAKKRTVRKRNRV